MEKSVKKAVAVKYCRDIDVPVILAKGEGRTAEKIVLEAGEAGVPVAENGVLVDLMELEKVGDVVPENAWTALAKVFAFIMEN